MEVRRLFIASNAYLFLSSPAPTPDLVTVARRSTTPEFMAPFDGGRPAAVLMSFSLPWY